MERFVASHKQRGLGARMRSENVLTCVAHVRVKRSIGAVFVRLPRRSGTRLDAARLKILTGVLHERLDILSGERRQIRRQQNLHSSSNLSRCHSKSLWDRYLSVRSSNAFKAVFDSRFDVLQQEFSNLKEFEENYGVHGKI